MIRCRWPVLFLVLVFGCSDIRLLVPEPDEAEIDLDNLLEVTGEYCTSPAADVPYPVKIMFIVDGSGSQQFSDQNRQRVVAVEETINALIRHPNVFFKVIVFNATVSATPDEASSSVYTNKENELVAALNNLAEADTLTDYQGALSMAYRELLRDMSDVFNSDPSDPTDGGGPAELGRTKYVNILISDGLPDPQCRAGLCNDTDPNFNTQNSCGMPNLNLLCESQDFLNCLLQRDGTSCNGGVCTYNGQTCVQQDEAAILFGGLDNTELAAGNDYNQPYQVLQRVADIMELGDRFEVGDLRVHAGLVLDPLIDPAVIEVFGDPAQAIPLMQQVAEIGQGQYLEFYGGDSIDFLTINFDTLKQHRVVRGMYADNPDARMRGENLSPDTDGDGLTDVEEYEIGSDSLNPDSDGDGFGDFLEWQQRGFSFDYDDPCLPPIQESKQTGKTSVTYYPSCGREPGSCEDDGSPCVEDTDCGPGQACVSNTCGSDADCINTAEYDRCIRGSCFNNRSCWRDATSGIYDDFDQDGLNDCEERQLGTNSLSPDSDSDGIPDFLDLTLGLDPLRWDFDADTDQDGLPNGTEVEWHLNPSREQSDMAVRERYRYDRELVGYATDGRPCFRFEIKKMQLAATGQAEERTDMGVGHNRLMFYLTENTADALGSTPVFRVACVWTRWVPPNLKVPNDGALRLWEEDFYYLPAKDPIFSEIEDPGSRLFSKSEHCLQACSDNTQCGCPTSSCWNGICRPASCCSDTDCGGEQGCVRGDCRQPCPVGDECTGQSACVAGHCLPTCTIDADCAPPRFCWQGHCSYFRGE